VSVGLQIEVGEVHRGAAHPLSMAVGRVPRAPLRIACDGRRSAPQSSWPGPTPKWPLPAGAVGLMQAGWSVMGRGLGVGLVLQRLCAIARHGDA
jgi:hypothetical protein